MNIAVTLNGTLEEVTIALNAIESHKKRSQELLPVAPLQQKLVAIPQEVVKKKQAPKNNKPIEIHIGSKESGFALHKIYNSMTDAARSLGLKEASNLQYYIKTGAVYKGLYKFIPHG